MSKTSQSVVTTHAKFKDETSRALLRNIATGNALVFSAYPGDEVLGCTAALLNHAKAGQDVRIIVLTDGAAESIKDRSAIREQARYAGQLIGVGGYEMWGLAVEDLVYGETLVRRLMDAIPESGVANLYAPSVFETDPARRALALAAMEAMRRVSGVSRTVQYEVGVPMVATALLDLSDEFPAKHEAISCLTWLEPRKGNGSSVNMLALNQFRAASLGPDVKAVEGYAVFERETVLKEPFGQSVIESLMHLPAGMEGGPLVSVIIRSMDRPSLSEALESVARQTWPFIELVVVAAKGPDHSPLPLSWGRYPLIFIPSENPLPRSQAANVGLANAAGGFFIFLDDDDLFLPDHIATLVGALEMTPEVKAAYAGVRVDIYQSGREAPERSFQFNESYNVDKLRGRNFIPIHAVLFHRDLVTKHGCRFDESFDLFEDWDFWLQVAQFTDLHHLDSVSAIYRNHGDSGLGAGSGDQGKVAQVKQATGLVLDKWRSRWSGDEWAGIIEYRESLCASASDHVNGLNAELVRIRKQSEDRAGAIAYLKGQLGQFEGRAHFLEQQSKDRAGVITHLEAQLGIIPEQKQRIEDLEAQLGTIPEQKQRIEDLEAQLGQVHWLLENSLNRETELNTTIAEITNSTSWGLTKPIRMISRLVRGDFEGAMISLRRNLGLQVGQDQSTENEDHNKIVCVCDKAVEVPNAAWTGEIIDLKQVTPVSEQPPGRIAIQVHAFYPDLVKELSDYLKNVPWSFDLYVSVASKEVTKECRRHFGRLGQLKNLTIREVPNRGRDIAPLLCQFKVELLSYDYIAHIHTKKSLYNDGATLGWREYLLESLLGSPEQIGRIFRLFTSDEDIGLIYPQSFSGLPYIANTWLSNLGLGRELCQRIGILNYSGSYQAYPTGSMFWARADALTPLFDLGLKLDDFPEEMGQTDGTMAHCLERMLPLSATKAGFRSAILRDEKMPSWSPCRLDQYLWGGHEHFEEMLTDPAIQLLVFDVFDTLLIRPLLNPESIKRLIARKLGGQSGEIFLANRVDAEVEARHIAQRDVGLDEIYRRFRELSGLPDEEVKKIRHQEEAMELAAVSRRPETAGLLELASAHGKRVVLASDMYLPREIIERMLINNGILGWEKLYLSSEVGLRKDSGGLYRFILEEESCHPHEVLVVGDNEQSDVQVPWNLGMKTRHVLRPVEIARALPRLKPLVESTLKSKSISDEITLGLVVRSNFHRATYKKFEPDAFTQGTPWAIGYSVLGPLTLAFSQWLYDRAKSDGIDRLYFLAREGQFLKLVLDRYLKSQGIAIDSEYLVVSRRCVSVAAVQEIDDIFKIAERRYHSGKAIDFLRERYGIETSDSELKEVWPDGGPDFTLEICEKGDITHIRSLLEVLKEKIFHKAKEERANLIEYLKVKGIYNTAGSAVVDIGYSATIQDYLNKLCLKSIHGYYIATSEKSVQVADRHQVRVEGCFSHQIGSVVSGPPILTRSFDLERMLSSNQPQVVYYIKEKDGKTKPIFNVLTELEKQARPTRDMLQRGAITFIDEAIDARTSLLSDFIVNPEFASNIYESFVRSHSHRERESLDPLVLDDYYCGRGVVGS